MFHFSKKGSLYGLVFGLTFTILVFMYLRRFTMFEWQWIYLVFLIYGAIALCVPLFHLTGAYLYKPVPDQGYRPQVSVIIPVYNEEDNIANTIDSIVASEYPKDKLELLVIDDKSKDQTLNVINKKRAQCNFKLITHEQNLGKRRALASGIKQSTGEIVVCIDSDTIVKPDTIKMVVQPFIDEKVYSVCGNTIVGNESYPQVDTIMSRFQKVWYAGAFRLRKGAESLFSIVLCCSGVLSAYRREKLEKVVDELVNEKFFGRKVKSGDDRRLTNLMLRMGGKSVFQSTAIAYTIAPHTLKNFVKQQLRWGRNSVRGMIFASKFFHKRELTQKIIFYITTFVTITAPFTFIASIVGLALSGSFEWAAVYVLGLMLTSALFALTDKLLVDYFTFKDIFYRVFFFNIMFIVTFVYLYAYITPWEGTSWGTR